VVLIERGQTVHEIAAEMVRVGLMQGTLRLEVLARLMRSIAASRPGQYSFPARTTVPALLRLLRGHERHDSSRSPRG